MVLSSSITLRCPICEASSVLTLVQGGHNIRQQQELEFYCPNGDVLDQGDVDRLWLERQGTVTR